MLERILTWFLDDPDRMVKRGRELASIGTLATAAGVVLLIFQWLTARLSETPMLASMQQVWPDWLFPVSYWGAVIGVMLVFVGMAQIRVGKQLNRCT